MGWGGFKLNGKGAGIFMLWDIFDYFYWIFPEWKGALKTERWVYRKRNEEVSGCVLRDSHISNVEYAC